MECISLSSVLGTAKEKDGLPRAQGLEDGVARSEVRDVAGTRLSGMKSLNLLSLTDCHLLRTFIYSHVTIAFLLSLLTAF